MCCAGEAKVWIGVHLSKILITGAAGFIGSSLAHAFTASGHEVRGLDNLSTGAMANLRDISGQFDFVLGDLRDTETVLKACSDIEIVLHQGAIASTTLSLVNPHLTHETNVAGTLNVLAAARAKKVRRVILASSAAVYGDQPECPQHEEMHLNPLSPYAVQKLECEQHLASFCEQHNMEGISLRYFNVFGPRQSTSFGESGVVVGFISQLLAGQIPTIEGNGQSSRDFTFIADVVHANELACLLPAQFADGRTYNIGTEHQTTIIELYRMLTHMLGIQAEPRFGPARSADITRSCARVQRAETELKYRTTTELTSCLAQTIKWIREEAEFSGRQLSLQGILDAKSAIGGTQL